MFLKFLMTMTVTWGFASGVVACSGAIPTSSLPSGKIVASDSANTIQSSGKSSDGAAALGGAAGAGAAGAGAAGAG